MSPSSPTDQAESWFLARGLPSVLTTRGRWRRLWSRSAPMLAAYATLHCWALPVLLVSGSRSDVVSRQTIAEFQRLVPHAEHQEVADATHMVVGDDNDTFTTHLVDFFERHA